MDPLTWFSGFAAGVAITGIVSLIRAHRERKYFLRQAQRSEHLLEMVETHRGDDLYLHQDLLTWDEVQGRLKAGALIGLQMDYREIKRRIGA
jgi:hypothetical protein